MANAKAQKTETTVTRQQPPSRDLAPKAPQQKPVRAPAGAQNIQGLHRRQISPHRIGAILSFEESRHRPGDGQHVPLLAKDFRDAVVAARAAQSGWAGRSAYNRGQIIYRIAEMLEGRAAQFIAEMVQMGLPKTAGRKPRLPASIDRLVYYAGWADKYQQIFSSVNPVASSHFNFSVLEPTGVVALLAPQNSALIGLISTIIPGDGRRKRRDRAWRRATCRSAP